MVALEGQENSLARSIIENSDDAIIGKNLDGTIVSWNYGAENIYGYSAKEAIGKSVSILVPEGKKNEIPAILERIKNGERVEHYETERKTKAGKTIIVSLTVSPVKDEEGNIIGASAISRDVTKRKEEQKERSLFGAIIHSSQDAFVGMDLDTKIISWNPGAERLFGYTEDEALGKSGVIIYPKEQAGELKKNIEKVKNGRPIAAYDTRRQKKDGTLIDVAVSASPIKDDDGNVVGIAVIDRDISAQKQASQYARSLVEASLDPLVTISAEGKITDVNEATVQVTGVAREELIGSDFSNYFTEPRKAREGYEQVFSKGRVIDYPLTIRHRSGKTIDVLYNASVYKDSQGNVLGVFAAARDVTAQKQASQYARSLIEASLDPLVTISPEGKITDVNEATAKVTGVTRENLIGTDFSTYFTEPTMAREGYEQVFKEGLVTDYPLTIRSSDGSLKDVLYNATVYKDEKGNVLGVFAAARDVTAQKQASQYARSLIEASLDPLVTISAEGKITDVNEATVQVTAVSRDRLIGSDFSNYFTDPEEARLGYQQVFKEGFVRDYPLAIKNAEGKIINVLYNATVYKDEKGNVLGVFAAARDITERQKAEDELHATSAYARSLIEASLDPLVTISPDGKITDVNHSTEQITGVTREWLIGTDFSDYFTEPRKAREGYRKVLKEGFVRDYPLAIRNADGRVVDVLYNASVYKDARGKARGIFAAARDVTETKKASQYARSLIEASLDPLVTISTEGKITDVNEATARVTGVSRDNLIGADFSTYFTEPRKAREGYEQVFKEGFVTDYPLTIRSASGKLTEVLYNASVYKDEKGNVLGVFAAARDYTRVKQTTEEVQESNKELEAFSYTVSHDLRAPLRSIDGFSKMLSEEYGDKLDVEGKRIIDTIRSSTEQMGTLIDDLLSFSRLSRQEMKLQAVDMKSLAQNVFDELKLAQTDRKIEFKIGDLPAATGDLTLLHEVWSNLISNAIKFTKFRNLATIEIDAKQNGDQVTYTIKDNGAGFDMKYVDKLFGVFQRLHSADEFEGTGIGLSVVKRIILRHKGKIWAESKLNEGTTFYFTLPVSGGLNNGK